MPLSMLCPVCSTIYDARTPAPEAPAKWGPRSGAVVLSNGDFTATAYNNAAAWVLSSASRSAGRRALRFVVNFTGDPTDEETLVGVVSDAKGGSINQNGYSICADGVLNCMGATSATAITFASGEDVFCYLDLYAGKGWFDTAADATASDREAGINPHFSFTAGPMRAGSDLWAVDNTPSASVTIDPAYSSGSFGAWG